uniref:Reverse transcriptase domain-containing protein n=1 Tax=Tanacetum cinerariifolium TaxID=118510 RepID=A0A699JQR7_TANCI|nr:hypothetical protein [Tanacetum cinerariifolium]
MSADSTVTYTSVHSEARSWSIPSVDSYEEAAQQLLEQAPRSLEYVPDPIELEDHVPFHIPEHPEDLVPAEDEAHIEAYIPEVASAPTPLLPPSFLSSRIRPPHTRAAMAQMRAAVPSTYHSLLPSGTPPLLPIPLPAPSTSRRAEIPEADTPPKKRLLLTAPRPGESLEFYSRHHDAQKDRAAVRAEIERQTSDDFAVQYIMRTQALEAGARIDILEDTENGTKENHKVNTSPPVTPAPTATTTTVTEAQLQALIDQGVDTAMAEAETSRVRNGYDSNGLGPRLAQVVRECTYPYFLKCQPLNFKGTEGVVGLTQWFEKMEFVDNISNCTAACQVKYAACTLQGVALTW